jgi:hypothetical protein
MCVGVYMHTEEDFIVVVKGREGKEKMADVAVFTCESNLSSFLLTRNAVVIMHVIVVL